MEIRRIVKADWREINRIFDFDEIMNIRYIERIDEAKYIIVVRIPECNLKSSNVPVKLSTLRNKIIKACSDIYVVEADAVYSDGSVRRIYASNKYWIGDHAKRHGETDGLTVKEIRYCKQPNY